MYGCWKLQEKTNLPSFRKSKSVFFSVSSGEAKRGRKDFRSHGCVNIAVQLCSTTAMRREARHPYYEVQFASLLSERYFSNFWLL